MLRGLFILLCLWENIPSVQYNSLKNVRSCQKQILRATRLKECNVRQWVRLRWYLVSLVDKKCVRSKYFVDLKFALMNYNHFKPTAGVPPELSNHNPFSRQLFQVSARWNSRWITADDYWQWQHFLLILYWCFGHIPTNVILLMVSVSVNKMNHQVFAMWYSDFGSQNTRPFKNIKLSWL